MRFIFTLGNTATFNNPEISEKTKDTVAVYLSLCYNNCVEIYYKMSEICSETTAKQNPYLLMSFEIHNFQQKNAPPD